MGTTWWARQASELYYRIETGSESEQAILRRQFEDLLFSAADTGKRDREILRSAILQRAPAYRKLRMQGKSAIDAFDQAAFAQKPWLRNNINSNPALDIDARPAGVGS